MARVSQDSTSWRAGGILRRDARSVRDDPSVRHPAKKDTRRWCKGKVGREHHVSQRPIFFGGTSWRSEWGDEDYCTVCGKVLKQRFKPYPWRRVDNWDAARV